MQCGASVPRFAALAATFMVAAALAGCGGRVESAPEPHVVTKEVKVAVPVPCPALEALGPEPVYPDTDEAIAAAPSIGELASLYAKGRVMRAQRLNEFIVAKVSCIF